MLWLNHSPTATGIPLRQGRLTLSATLAWFANQSAGRALLDVGRAAAVPFSAGRTQDPREGCPQIPNEMRGLPRSRGRRPRNSTNRQLVRGLNPALGYFFRVYVISPINHSLPSIIPYI